jgi:hypothetical protein
MSDQKPDLPRDDETQAVATTETQHLEPHPPSSAAWTTWVPSGPASRRDSEAPAAPAPEAPEPTEHLSPVAPPPVPAPAPWSPPPSRPQVTYLPPPSGPNWGLVIVGLVFGLVGAGVVANQVSGFQVSSLTELGPSVLVVAGLACALLGLVGIVTRRRRG